MHLEPIGYISGASDQKAAAPQQAVLADQVTATIELIPGRNWGEALDGLLEFARIWIIFHFHRASDRGNKVHPPGSLKRRGVLATRSPHRPNPIGLSCVELMKIEGSTLHIRGHDLLNETPILDIKPYLPFADSFSEARTGWHAGAATPWRIGYTPPAYRQLAWLKDAGVDLAAVIQSQLSLDPTRTKHRRVEQLGEDRYKLASGTWRIFFTIHESTRSLTIQQCTSGYAEQGRWPEGDPYKDRTIHQAFIEAFPDKTS